MSAFLSPLQLEYIDGKKWLVVSPFTYHLGEPDGLEHVTVPIGFITDFASIPRPLWPVWPPTGKYGKAAVIHDKLYTDAYVARGASFRRFVTRGEADRILLEAMQVLGVGRFTRGIIYAGVRAGGWLPWKQYRDRPPLPPV